MFSCAVSSPRRNLNRMNWLEDERLLFRSLMVNKTNEFLFTNCIRAALKQPCFCWPSPRPTSICNKMQKLKCDDYFHVALNGDHGVGAHGSWQWAGCVPATRSVDFLWLSLTQITESCIWEPWMGSPAIPKLGKIGTQQDSRCYLALFACRTASGWHRTGDGAVLVPRGSWVLALWSLFGNVWIDLPF